VQQLAIDDPRFAPVLDVVAEREGFVLVHVGPIPWNDDTNDGPSRVARVLERHPKLRVVVAHFGVPDYAGYAARMATLPNLYLDTTMAFTPDSSLDAHTDRAFVESIADRIVFGTDYPNTPHGYGADLDGLAALGVSESAMQKIGVTNARHLTPAFAAASSRA
jgi:predicted TIM-barrel fold metal-dependent hydrolase